MDLSAHLSALTDDPEAADGAEPKEQPPVSTQITVDAPAHCAAGTVVLMCGSTDYANVVKGGKTKPKVVTGEEFNSPVRICGTLDQVRVLSLGVGPCAAHCIALASDGRIFAWGLNTSGQLGLGDKTPEAVPGPTVAPLWTAETTSAPVKAACGRNHTLICFENGAVLSCGAGARGALGTGVRKTDLKELSPAPKRVVQGDVTEATLICDVAAGADFSLAVCKAGKLYSWGWTEFGKLGHGDDGCYNTKASSIKLAYTAAGTPKRVRIPRDDDAHGARVVSCAAGKNHAACVCEDGQGLTWGDGAYGKLGHRTQDQGNRPRILEGVRFSTLACGDMSTCGLAWPEYRGRSFTKPDNNDGMVYVWGVLKGTHGEGATRPIPEYELQGWSVKPAALAMGATHVALAAEGNAIAWSQTCVAYGQLGYGDSGPKSSNKPQKLKALEGAATIAQVVAAAGATYFLADATDEVLKKLPDWTPPEPSADAIDANAANQDPKAKKAATTKKGEDAAEPIIKKKPPAKKPRTKK